MKKKKNWNLILGGIITVVTVSYTHLDVYKRQEVSKSEEKAARQARMNQEYMADALEAARDADAVIYIGGLTHDYDTEGQDRTSMKPVSYTHLDHTYIMDTPGFSSLSLFDIEKEELKSYYPEFEPYEDSCKFLTCAHIHEPVCGVKDALELGKISQVRYDNYVSFYEELKEKEKRKY